jgi:SAM-dependent methyltransferase
MKYKKLKSCRLCFSSKLSIFIDFKKMPLAGAFLRKNQIKKEFKYPMAMQFCNNCSNVQVDTVIPLNILFKKYFYFSSNIKTLIDHFGDLSQLVQNKFLTKKKSTVLEIGCNDGVFLNHLVKNKNIKCIGVDPAQNVVKKIKNKKVLVYNKPFNFNLAKKIKLKANSVDLIVSSFSFGHIDNMNSVAKGIDFLLDKNGIFIFEIYYLGTVIKGLQYDMMYHEHMTYYTIKALRKFLAKYDLRIFDIEKIKLRSGSLRFYCCRLKNVLPNSENVIKFINYENKNKFNQLSYLKNYKIKIDKTKKNILKKLRYLKNKGKKIYGYGASGRGTIIMNYCKIDGKFLDYVVDDAPEKKNMYTPGTHVKIISWDDLEKVGYPDYFVLFAWPFYAEIIKKRREYLNRGGKFLVPLPKVKIIH